MLVLGAVSDSQLYHLRRARPARFALAPARTWGEALATIRTRPVELAVVDPLLAGRASECEIERLRVMFPSLPFILYTTLTPETAAVLLALGQRGIRHVVAAARVLYAHRLLRDPGFTIEDVAERLGYAQTKTLQLHARTYLGLTVGEMRLTLAPEEALQRVVRGFLLSRRGHTSLTGPTPSERSSAATTIRPAGP